MNPTNGDYDITEVKHFKYLKERIIAFNEADTKAEHVEIVSELLLNGHKKVSGYLVFGNNKVADNTGIFNMNSATDCPNADTTEDDQSDTGVCQVPWSDCYAHKSENVYDAALKKRRLQEYLWDNVDVVTFAKALLRVKERMRSDFEYLRVSESGDFRHRGDIIKWNTIAEIVSPEIQVYTYSASHKLDWSYAEHFVVNQSNNLADYGDRSFNAVTESENIPDDAIYCAFDAATENGIEGDDRPKCGQCTKCIEPESEQPRDVFIRIH